MKKLIFITVFTAASFLTKAQAPSIEGFRIGLGTTLAIPANNLEGISIGVGADVLAMYGISPQFAITADLGYQSLFAKNNGGSLDIIPIRVGARYFATPSFYLGGKVGLGIISGGLNDVTATAYSFGAGYYLSPKIDVGASYDGYSKNGSFGLVGIRLGYTFGNN